MYEKSQIFDIWNDDVIKFNANMTLTSYCHECIKSVKVSVEQLLGNAIKKIKIIPRILTMTKMAYTDYPRENGLANA